MPLIISLGVQVLAGFFDASKLFDNVLLKGSCMFGYFAASFILSLSIIGMN